MKDSAVGWLFVVIQAGLLVTIVVVPGADHWERPIWLVTVASVCIVAGVVVAAVAALGLGPALRMSPTPAPDGELRTDGPYRLVRHPIYAGVILAIVGAAVRSGSAIVAAVVAATIAFFTVKASWEERRLVERYPGYPSYAVGTPRFVPRPGAVLAAMTPRRRPRRDAAG